MRHSEKMIEKGTVVDNEWSSCLSAFLSQPPCTTVQICVQTGYDSVECSERNEAGVRCKDILEVSLSMLPGMEVMQNVLRFLQQSDDRQGKVFVLAELWVTMSDDELKRWTEEPDHQVTEQQYNELIVESESLSRMMRSQQRPGEG